MLDKEDVSLLGLEVKGLKPIKMTISHKIYIILKVYCIIQKSPNYLGTTGAMREN